MSIRLGIVRTATALDRYRLDPRSPIEAPPPGEHAWLTGHSAWAVLRSKLEAGHRLEAVWGRLAGPRPLDATLLADVLDVLAHTLLDTARRWPSPPPLPDEPPPPPRPTAAHPRAYRGTRYTPPKTQTPTVADPRRHLSGLASTRALLERLAPFRDAAAATLTARGLPAPMIERLIADDWPDPEPTLAAAPDAGRWPAGFREIWLPTLLDQPRANIATVYSAWRRLGLDGDADLSAAALALALAAGADGALYWLDGLAALSPEARSPWLHAALGAGLVAAGARFEPTLAELEQAIGARGHWLRVWTLCAHRAAGGGSAYLLQGFALNDRRAHRRPLTDAPPANAPIDEATLWRYLERTRAEEGEPTDRAVYLWADCGRLPGLIDVLSSVCETDLSPVAASNFVRMISSVRYDDHGPAVGRAKWSGLRAQSERLLAAVAALAPDQRVKAVHLLWEAVLVSASPPAMNRLIERHLRLMPTVCAAGSPSTPWADGAITTLSDTLDDAGFERLMRSPPGGWLALLDACRRKNASWLVELGTTALAATAPGLLLDAFAHAPKPLWRTMCALGAMDDDRGAQVARALLADPLARRDWADWPLADLCAALADRAGDGVPDPVPRTLKRHLIGERRLTAGQLERQRRRLLRPEVRPTVLLGLLRAAAATELTRGFDVKPDSGAVLHALQIVAMIDDNRRILRRVLRARWRGVDLVRTHPLTRRWWAAHPAIPEAVWRAEHSLTIDDPSPMTLRVEIDPVEVLRMGTFAGSCLGLGGGLTYSAAAVAVDDNKRVIYARDPTGRVIARQLVALGDADRLVCFDIYPETRDPALPRVFARLAHRLARALGVELFDAGVHDGYTVALILAQHWWDDDATRPAALSGKRPMS